MDALIRHREAHLAECHEQIEKSHQMISLSQRWLTAYHDSVNQKMRNLSVFEEELRAKAVASRK